MAISSTPTGSEIAAEYGIALAGSKGSDYLGRNGLPTAKPIKGSDFIGKSNLSYGLANASVIDVKLGSGAAQAGIYIYRNGGVNIYEANSGGYQGKAAWITPNSTSVGDNYQIRFTLSSGNSSLLSGSGLNTWHRLNATRYMVLSYAGTSGFFSSNILAELRPNGGGATLDSATYSLRVTKEI